MYHGYSFTLPPSSASHLSSLCQEAVRKSVKSSICLFNNKVLCFTIGFAKVSVSTYSKLDRCKSFGSVINV